MLIEEMLCRMDEAFASQGELLCAICAWADAVLAQEYARDPWVGRDPQLLQTVGLVVTREEFEETLRDAGEVVVPARGETAEAIDTMLRCRMEKTGDALPYLRAVRVLNLSICEERALRLALAAELDAKYEKLFGYLQDDVTRKRPMLRWLARLCGEAGEWIAAVREDLLRSCGLAALCERNAWENGELKLSAAFVRGLFDKKQQDAAEFAPLDLYPDQTAQMRRLIEAGTRTVVLLDGDAGCGRRTALRQAAGRAVILCAEQELGDGIAQAALMGGVLCIAGSAPTPEAIPTGLLPVFVLEDGESAEPVPEYALRLRFDALTDEKREQVYRYWAKREGLAQDCATELAAKFLLTPGRISAAMRAARRRQEALGRTLTKEDIHEAVTETLQDPGGLTREGKLAFTLDDLILPEEEKKRIRQAVGQVLLRRKVYEDWGFGDKTPYGRGVSVLLSGPPGTGKTMAARVIAGQLHMKLRVVQLSQVISKYIGETEKNLLQVFEQARQSSAVLFFDECDALFGKRGEVRDAQDRHSNAEVAFLLQQMEAHEGVTILATNLSQNIDAAFMRRMRFVIHFPFPDKDTRVKLYRAMLPKLCPVEEDIDYDFIAEKFAVAGGNIKNIVLHAAFLAAAQDAPVGMAHLLSAAVYEQRKNGSIVVREELRQYEDLLEE